MELTEKQKRFVAEYLIEANATQAAIKAGYSPRTANEQGCRLLAHVSVKEAIEKAQRKRELRTDITADRVLHELADIGFNKESERTTDRLKALELMGKHLAMFTDKVNVDADSTITFRFERPDGDNLMG